MFCNGDKSTDKRNLGDEVLKNKFKMNQYPPAPLVAETFFYNEADGKLYWKISTGSKKRGDRAGTETLLEGVRIKWGGRFYNEKVLVWILHYGEMCIHGLRYKDGNIYNNRITNLEPRVRKKKQYIKKRDRLATDNAPIPPVSFI